MKGYLLPVIVTCLFYTKMATFATVRQHHFDVNPIMELGAGLGFTISKISAESDLFCAAGGPAKIWVFKLRVCII